MDVVVDCHSGHTYAERPVAFYLNDEKLGVETILAEWRSPDHKHFRVRTGDGSIFELIFDEASDNWQVRQA